MNSFDVVVIGAGAAGLFAAGAAGQRGLRVLLIDHAAKVAEKIRISGGGRSNFTNRDATPANYLGDNPHFCRSALSQYTSADFIKLVQSHGIAFHEKHKGQLFCDHSSQQLIDLLLAECAKGGVERWQPCGVQAVRRHEGDEARFELDTDRGLVRCHNLVVATGGLSIPKIGATDFGHRLATQFGHRITPLRPALVPLTFDATLWTRWSALSGVAVPVTVSVTPPPPGGKGKARPVSFDEDLLFTHRGLSGPAILQISSYWAPGLPLSIDLAPGTALASALKQAKQGSKRQLSTVWREALPESLPQRLALAWLADIRHEHPALRDEAPAAELKDKDLDALGQSANAWTLTPSGTEGYAKAEVTAGGVDTRELSSQTMESRLCPGLYFIGEVVDVTGWLGGYNFQWAWSSGMACARALQAA
ncbi:MAG TPA: NAD(P)/FAD-dependent oxidoreductase [Aquabacterium sp.]|uniref:NAD(P)/FAD-dependent oxidoreductase n=1 Tax=Aquabacterium sp. TaxID=1872578 RepID=UPI002E343E07|nr:NAD(P)/FAD-dependent oxidoreductase [Aquabacterium sp.]HEX5372006.1 NAD(P)/FAD-dependent oxidoreductase [Aquabacterium sp.]